MFSFVSLEKLSWHDKSLRLDFAHGTTGNNFLGQILSTHLHIFIKAILFVVKLITNYISTRHYLGQYIHYKVLTNCHPIEDMLRYHKIGYNAPNTFPIKGLDVLMGRPSNLYPNSWPNFLFEKRILVFIIMNFNMVTPSQRSASFYC